MNFEEKIETQIEALRVSFNGFLKVRCPYFNDFDNEFITIDDVIDFTIYEGIKKCYDYYASKEKISEYVKNSSSLTERPLSPQQSWGERSKQ